MELQRSWRTDSCAYTSSNTSANDSCAYTSSNTSANISACSKSSLQHRKVAEV